MVDEDSNPIADEDGNPNDMHFLATLTADGNYFAEVTATHVYQGHLYIPGTARNWDNARAFAQSFGGDLVSVNDQAEQDFVTDRFSVLNPWLGLNDIDNEGTHVWANGDPVTYTNWSPGEPNTPSWDGAYLSTNGLWFDYPVSSTWGVLAEVDPPVSTADGGPGPFAQYVLAIEVADTVPPKVVDLTRIPNEGESTDEVIATFDVIVSEGLISATVNNPVYDFAEFNGHTYLATPDAMTWSEAEAYAQGLGGNLVTINDQAEQDFLHNRYLNDGYWIGLTREAGLSVVVNAELTATDPDNPARLGSYYDDHLLTDLVTPAADELVIVDLESLDFDTILQLVNSNTGEVLLEDDDGGQDVNSRFAFNFDPAITYAIRATSYDSASTGAYTLTAQLLGEIVWSNGELFAYDNWAFGEQDFFGNDGAILDSFDGAWYSAYAQSVFHGIVEIPSVADTDFDGIPDALDFHPNDPLNGWSLRASGVDGAFDTADDILYDLRVSPEYSGGTTIPLQVTDGPLDEGQYRLAITDSLSDIVGNRLDGDSDGTAGGMFTQMFTVEFPEGFLFEGRSNDSLATATPLPLTEDPPGSGFSVGRGMGSIDPSGDTDWWSFTANAGDLISIAVDPVEHQSVDSEIILRDSSGGYLSGDRDGGPGQASYVSHYEVPADGTFFVELLADSFGSRGNYQIRIERARGIDLESDRFYLNDAIANASPIRFTTAGDQRIGVFAGTIMAGESGNVDEDYIDLGIVDADDTILLSSRLPSSSVLRPIVEIRDEQNNVVSINSNPSDAVARADISVTARYYAVVLGNSGAGVFGQYLIDAAIQPTSQLSFADLFVSELNVPANASSGETVSISWTVGNFGAVSADTPNWTDRVVLSSNDQYGDSDDIQLTSFARVGALGVDETYSPSVNVQIPLDAEGPYYWFVETDSNRNVPEFIFESNNVRVSDAASTVTLTPNADLDVNDVVTPASAVAGEMITVNWTVKNQGLGTTGDGTPLGDVNQWTDRVVLSKSGQFGNADNLLLADVTHDGTLDPAQEYAGEWSGTLPAGLDGSYTVFVSTDYGKTVYEAGRESNNLQFASLDIIPFSYADLQLSDLSFSPAAIAGGESLSVTWTTVNRGVGPTTSSWIERVVLSTDNVLDGGDLEIGRRTVDTTLAVDAQVTQTDPFALPIDLQGDFFVFVQTDVTNALDEYQFENNNVSLAPGMVSVVPGNKPDLTIPTLTGDASALSGTNVSIAWTVGNVGSEVATANWIDRVYLSVDEVLDVTDIELASVSHTEDLVVDGTYNVQHDLMLSNDPIGAFFILVATDRLDTVNELDETNNVATIPLTIDPAPTPDLRFTAASIDLSEVQPQQEVTLRWTVENAGDASTSADWSDHVYLSTDGTIANGVLLATERQSSPLAAGQSQLTSKLASVPNLSDGEYWVVVSLDSLDELFERDGEDDNVFVLPQPITIGAR